MLQLFSLLTVKSKVQRHDKRQLIKEKSHIKLNINLMWLIDCASGGNRTRTRVAANRILSPACLPVPPPRLVPKKNPEPPTRTGLRAKDRARTGHPDLGKVVLYQMSYFRDFFIHFCKSFSG